MGMWGLEEIGGNWSRIQECFLGGYKNVLKFITVMAALQCDYTKKHWIVPFKGKVFGGGLISQ